MFWKTVKQLFGNKIKGKSQIAEGNDLVADSKALVKTFIIFFVNVVASHGIKYKESSYDDSNFNINPLLCNVVNWSDTL